jgi:hypothetical protein
MVRRVWVGVLVLWAGGCNIAQEAGRTVCHEPQAAWSQWVIRQRLQRQAQQAWRQVRAQYEGYAPEFREGFIDGYVDYLDRGGPLGPPAVPPARYWRQARYYTAEGHARLQQYFAGFQLGQQEALASGQRQYLTVPVLLPPPAQEPPVFRTASPPPMPPAPAARSGANPSRGSSSGSGEQNLPPPRAIDQPGAPGGGS